MTTDKLVVVQAFCIVYFVVLSLFTIPMCLLCGYKLKRYWNSQFIIKRRRSLILLKFILFSWHSFIEFPFFVIFISFNLPMKLISFFGFVYVISLVIRCITGSLFLLRAYLLYYDHEYEKILSQSKWQILIDPHVEQTNWFLVNRRHKYGRASYLIKRFILPSVFLYFIIFCIVLFTTANYNSLLNDKTGLLFTAIWCIMLVIIGIYYWRKYPKILDKWNIRDEIGLSIKILSCFPAMLILGAILLIVGVIHASVSLLFVFISLELCVTGIFYVLLPYSSSKQNNNNSDSAAVTIIQSSIDRHILSWQDTIKMNDGYEQFACFLESEFSVENILFITEYVYIKNVMLQKKNFKHIIENKLNLTYTITIPDSAPMSIIARGLSEMIHNESIGNAFITATKTLVDKYIDYTAVLEVNISSRMRNQVLNVFKTLQQTNKSIMCHSDETLIGMVLPLLEECVNEVSYLMNDTQMRFRRSSVFAELMQQNAETET
eukprot:339020_1